MSLKTTETFYNLVIEHVLKEINDDPQMNGISTEAIDFLGKTWKAKLHDSGVYIPHNNEYHKQHMPLAYPLIRPAFPETFMPAIAPSSTTKYAYPQEYPSQEHLWMQGFHNGQYHHPYEIPFDKALLGPGAPLGHPGLRQFLPHYDQNVYNAKPIITDNQMPHTARLRSPFINQPPDQSHPKLIPAPAYPPQHPDQNTLTAKPTLPSDMSNQMRPNSLLTTKEQPLDQNTANSNDRIKNSINIKTEPSREEEEQNSFKGPVKVTNTPQSLIDISTPKRSVNTEAMTPSNRGKDKDQKNSRKEDEDDEEDEEEEEKKDGVFHSEDENQEKQDVDYFDYDAKPADVQPKEEHIPPPIQQPSAIAQAPVRLEDLDPYDPQDRPLDSDDDPDDGDLPETTDILFCFHEKVHRHGTKWKVVLKQGIMNAKGKEYILSQINGEFDFM